MIVHASRSPGLAQGFDSVREAGLGQSGIAHHKVFSYGRGEGVELLSPTHLGPREFALITTTLSTQGPPAQEPHHGDSPRTSLIICLYAMHDIGPSEGHPYQAARVSRSIQLFARAQVSKWLLPAAFAQVPWVGASSAAELRSGMDLMGRLPRVWPRALAAFLGYPPWHQILIWIVTCRYVVQGSQ